MGHRLWAIHHLVQRSFWRAVILNNVFRNPNFLLYSTSIALVISGKFMVNPFVKDFAVHNVGLSKWQPALILSICSGIDIISRPLGGYICSSKFIREKLGTFETFTISVIGLGLVNLFAPFFNRLQM